jgi:hypothetical protein
MVGHVALRERALPLADEPGVHGIATRIDVTSRGCAQASNETASSSG